MAFSLQPGANIDPTSEANAELQELRQLIDLQRNLLVEESGFEEIETQITVQDALKEKGINIADLEGMLQRAERSGLAASQVAENLGISQQALQQMIETRSRAIPLFDEGQRLRQEAQALRARGRVARADELQRQGDEKIRQFNNLSDTILNIPITRTSFEKTQERLDQEARLKEFQAKQEEILNLQADRQAKALKGELPLTEATQQAKREQFQQFKEGQARIGNEIVGDTLETAAAKGTGAQKALENFRQRFAAVESAERQGEIFGGGQLFQSALGQRPTLGPGFAGTVPQVASPFGLQSTLAASSPFFQQQQLNLQRQALEAQRSANKSRSGRSGLLGSAGGLLGAGLGAALAAPTGGLSLTQGALLGNLFGSGTGNIFGAFGG